MELKFTACQLLSALAIKSTGPGKCCDRADLWAFKSDDPRRNGVCRRGIFGRWQVKGSGSITDVALRKAHELAPRSLTTLAKGKDPIKVRADGQAPTGSANSTTMRLCCPTQ